MADPVVWENIPKSQTDPTTISEAIAAGVAVHNDDSEAHLDTSQSLEQHRTNDIIDHPAESTVNDKMPGPVRAYVAIVDPASGNDFDTLSQAVDHAIDQGGGTIKLVAGTHEIAEVLDIPNNINLEGTDADDVIISSTNESSYYIRLNGSVGSTKITQSFTNLTFDCSTNSILRRVSGTGDVNAVFAFNSCNFTGGAYGNRIPGTVIFTNCYFEVNTSYYAFLFCGPTVLTDCIIQGLNGSASNYFSTTETDTPIDPSFVATNVKFYNTYTGNNYLAYNPSWESAIIQGCYFEYVQFSGYDTGRYDFLNNRLVLGSGGRCQFSGTRSQIIGNVLTGGAATTTFGLNLASSYCVMTGNSFQGVIYNSGTSNLQANNLDTG